MSPLQVWPRLILGWHCRVAASQYRVFRQLRVSRECYADENSLVTRDDIGKGRSIVRGAFIKRVVVNTGLTGVDVCMVTLEVETN